MASKPNWFDPLIVPTPNGAKIALGDIYIYASGNGYFTATGVNRPFGNAYSMMRHFATMAQKAQHLAEVRARKKNLGIPPDTADPPLSDD